MRHLPVAAGLIVAAGLLIVAPDQVLALASAPSKSPSVIPESTSAEPRSARFDVTGPNGSGNVQLGQPLELSMTLSGIDLESTPIVAICESAHFESQIVPLKHDPHSSAMKATATFRPVASDQLTSRPQVSRLHVTFARSTETKFERLMTRVMYLTMNSSLPARDEPASLTTNQDQPNEPDLAANQAEPLPSAIPLVGEEVAEEDLLPSRSVHPTPAYWDQVRNLLNQSWNRATNQLSVPVSPQTVLMHFRLYPGGHAQLLQIADGSGTADLDQAGIRAIADVQPFPPFPLGMGNEPIDIQVRLQTGSQVGVREFRTSSLRQLGRTISAPNY